MANFSNFFDGAVLGGTHKRKDLYFFIPENKHHINFIVMFIHYFQFLIIHVNGRISFGPVTFSQVSSKS